jgi:hypothetical protein
MVAIVAISAAAPRRRLGRSTSLPPLLCANATRATLPVAKLQGSRRKTEKPRDHRLVRLQLKRKASRNCFKQGNRVEKKKGTRKWYRRICEKIYFARWLKVSTMMRAQELNDAARRISSNIKRLRISHMIKSVLPVIVCLNQKGLQFRVQTKIWKKKRAVRWIKSFVFKCKLELAIKRVRWAGKRLSAAAYDFICCSRARRKVLHLLWDRMVIKSQREQELKDIQELKDAEILTHRYNAPSHKLLLQQMKELQDRKLQLNRQQQLGGWQHGSSYSLFKRVATKQKKKQSTAYRGIKERLVNDYLRDQRKKGVREYQRPPRQPITLTICHASCLLRSSSVVPVETASSSPHVPICAWNGGEGSNCKPNDAEANMEARLLQQQQQEEEEKPCLRNEDKQEKDEDDAGARKRRGKSALQSVNGVDEWRRRELVTKNAKLFSMHALAVAAGGTNGITASTDSLGVSLADLSQLIAGTVLTRPQRPPFMCYTPLTKDSVRLTRMIKTASTRCSMKSIADGIITAKRLSLLCQKGKPPSLPERSDSWNRLRKFAGGSVRRGSCVGA